MSRRTSWSASSADGIDTPKTECAPTFPRTLAQGVQPGKLYYILFRDTKEVVTLTEGQVKLEAAGTQPQLGNIWACVERDGFLGFRNCVSGTYLGHDGKEMMVAKANQHREWEDCCVRRAPCGAYYILVVKRVWFGCQLWQLARNTGAQTLTVTKYGGSDDRWEFEQVIPGQNEPTGELDNLLEGLVSDDHHTLMVEESMTRLTLAQKTKEQRS